MGGLPNGISKADINGRGAAIECYLDLRLDNYPPAKVIWTNYVKEHDIYHGALEYKDSYTKKFMRQTQNSIATGDYDFSKIMVLLDSLVSECTNIACLRK